MLALDGGGYHCAILILDRLLAENLELACDA